MYQVTINRKSNSKKIIDDIKKQMPNAMEKVMSFAKSEALKRKRGNKNTDLILFEITMENNIITGRLYTNFDYALFLEYGTGDKAEMPHIGHTETFKKSGYKYWFLPKEIADDRGLKLNESRLISIEGNLFYIMFATTPYPFMQPTAFELENNATKIFAKALIENI